MGLRNPEAAGREFKRSHGHRAMQSSPWAHIYSAEEGRSPILPHTHKPNVIALFSKFAGGVGFSENRSIRDKWVLPGAWPVLSTGLSSVEINI